jgi:hypothetical protein
VPVAVDLCEVRSAKGEAGDFFRSAYAQKPQYQGLWLTRPDGKVVMATLQGIGGTSDWSNNILAALHSALDELGPIAPRRVRPINPFPYRGVGIRADGSVTLAVSDRQIIVKDLALLLRAQDGQVFLDQLTLTAREWSALVPSEIREGSQWAIPEDVGRPFYRLLNPFDVKFVDSSEMTEFQLAGKVASVRAGVAHLVYRGHLAGTHHGMRSEGRLGQQLSSDLKMIGGVGTCDLRSGRMLSLTWVWDGSYTTFFTPPDRGDLARFAMVVEWRRGDATAGAPLTVNAPESSEVGKIGVADSTPEDALKTFLIGLATNDEATLRAIALPDGDLEWLWHGPASSPDRVARLRARLDRAPMRRLIVGDPVTMPTGEARVIKPADVREGRVVLWPADEPLPSRVEDVGGHWKVLARPFIKARKEAEAGTARSYPISADRRATSAVPSTSPR